MQQTNSVLDKLSTSPTVSGDASDSNAAVEASLPTEEPYTTAPPLQKPSQAPSTEEPSVGTAMEESARVDKEIIISPAALPDSDIFQKIPSSDSSEQPSETTQIASADESEADVSTKASTPVDQAPIAPVTPPSTAANADPATMNPSTGSQENPVIPDTAENGSESKLPENAQEKVPELPSAALSIPDVTIVPVVPMPVVPIPAPVPMPAPAPAPMPVPVPVPGPAIAPLITAPDGVRIDANSFVAVSMPKSREPVTSGSQVVDVVGRATQLEGEGLGALKNTVSDAVAGAASILESLLSPPAFAAELIQGLFAN
jgi:hypothetical protein